MIVAIIATCSDSSSRSEISSITGRSVHIDLPKSSLAMPTIQSPNWVDQRLVEAEPLALHLDGFLRDVAAVAAQLHLHDVARHDAQHEEHEHRDADQRRDHQQDAVDGVAEHAGDLAAARSSRRAASVSILTGSARLRPRSAPRLWLGDIFQPITVLWRRHDAVPPQQRLLIGLLEQPLLERPDQRLALLRIALAQVVVVELVELRILRARPVLRRPARATGTWRGRGWNRP